MLDLNVDNPIGIYMFKVNSGNARTMREICSNSMIAPEQR